jgi:hypothetical protein
MHSSICSNRAVGDSLLLGGVGDTLLLGGESSAVLEPTGVGQDTISISAQSCTVPVNAFRAIIPQCPKHTFGLLLESGRRRIWAKAGYMYVAPKEITELCVQLRMKCPI